MDVTRKAAVKRVLSPLPYPLAKPGRPDEERKRFAALMRKVEAIRVRYGMKESALAGELETTADALRNWMSGRAIGGKETVARPRGVYSASNSAI
jgi:hypothetical protein